MTTYDVAVIGAGLAGLTAARRLQRAGLATVVMEARSRLGGRILSVTMDGTSDVYDLGPAWFWDGQPHVAALAAEAGAKIFAQYETGDAVFERDDRSEPQRFAPTWQQPISYRIEGGVARLVDFLAGELMPDSLRLEHIVHEIVAQGDKLAVHATHGPAAADATIHARQVIVTLPPHLAATTIDYAPPLPGPIQAAMLDTPTWMGQAMKVLVAYERPFWREEGLSGMGLSYAGPVLQFHDASPVASSSGALFGWIGDAGAARLLTPAARQAAVVEQITRLFDLIDVQPTGYAEMNWAAEPFTNGSLSAPRAGDHPQYGHPLLQTPCMDGRLHWAGTEVSQVNGGYLDGAIAGAERIAAKIMGAK